MQRRHAGKKLMTVEKPNGQCLRDRSWQTNLINFYEEAHQRLSKRDMASNLNSREFYVKKVKRRSFTSKFCGVLICPVEGSIKYCSAQVLGLSDLSRRLHTAVLCPQQAENYACAGAATEARKRMSSYEDGRDPDRPWVEQFSGQTSIALMRYEKENPYTDDRKGYASKPNCDLTVFNKTVHIASALKATVSNVKSFNDMSDKVLLKSPVRSNVVVFMANDSEISDNEETSFSEPGNTTLEDFYPQMIQNMSRVWNVNMRNMAAFNILRHYRRQILFRHKLIAVKMVNRSNRNKPFEHIVDNRAVYRDSPLPCKQHKEENCVTALCNGSRASSDFCKMANSPTRSVINESQMLVDIAKSSYGKDSRQQHTPSRRKYFSGSSMWQSPKNKIVRVNCNMSEMAGSTSRYLTSQSLVDVDERKHGCYNEHTGQLVDKTRSLTRRNSFSGFPVAHSPNKEFENLYKKLTQAKCGPDYTLVKAKVQFSNTIASLVNSPGSVRAKRPISHDLSFSMSKKPRSATEAVVGTSKSSTCSPTWSGASCAQSHLVASALPVHMWPYSSGSQLKRSISPGKNGGSPKRTNARIYRKLTYQDEDR
ncbi:unnamed protein product [Ranitomeya imitator]|uniref:Uncharacterized protein n=1 Tax=Ranitomeya imitator TaxID=111125 RepID=A0ABN9MEM0_9NEOB|nr:unnamed protein product [Ranitomeya imitator]